MKSLRLCLIGSVAFFMACNQAQKTPEENDLDTLMTHIDDTAEKLDSTVLAAQEELFNTDTVKAAKPGKHPITLQWISWDNPGSAVLRPLEDGWYAIEGKQTGKEGDYLLIKGKVKRISPKELKFDGRIETRIQFNNGGEPCVKEGEQTFFAKGNRTYYRLQHMENCEGGRLLDYVDIYPGTSGL